MALAIGLYWLIRFFDQGKAQATDSPIQNEITTESVIGVRPASFEQVSEFTVGTRQMLRMSGYAEPDSVIVISNRGERLRQIRADNLGQWSVTLDADTGPMALEAQVYTDERTPSIRSEETIFRLPVPQSDEVAAANYTTAALIMLTAPGRPSRVVQSPFGGVPTSGPLSLSVIDYDFTGGVIITGTSSVPGRIRIYAQNSVIGETGVGVSGRWNYIADGRRSISVPFNYLPPLRDDQANSSGALSVNFEPLQWQVRRTLVGGGGQSTVIFSPDIVE